MGDKLAGDFTVEDILHLAISKTQQNASHFDDTHALALFFKVNFEQKIRMLDGNL